MAISHRAAQRGPRTRIATRGRRRLWRPSRRSPPGSRATAGHRTCTASRRTRPGGGPVRDSATGSSRRGGGGRTRRGAIGGPEEDGEQGVEQDGSRSAVGGAGGLGQNPAEALAEPPHGQGPGDGRGQHGPWRCGARRCRDPATAGRRRKWRSARPSGGRSRRRMPGNSSAPQGGCVLHLNRVVVTTTSSGARRCDNDVVGTGPVVNPSGLCHPASPGHHTFPMASVRLANRMGAAQLALSPARPGRTPQAPSVPRVSTAPPGAAAGRGRNNTDARSMSPRPHRCHIVAACGAGARAAHAAAPGGGWGTSPERGSAWRGLGHEPRTRQRLARGRGARGRLRVCGIVRLSRGMTQSVGECGVSAR
jgi:hypothetical protein